MLPRESLRPYQVELADRIVSDFGEKPGLLLAIQMSLGKTATVLTGIRDLLDQLVVRKVLIVAPLLVAQVTWPDEIKNWSHTRAIRHRVMCGNRTTRTRALRDILHDPSIEVGIINRENLPWLWRTLRGKKHWPFDMLVYDESSRMKSGSQRTKNRRMSEFGVIAASRPLMRYAVLLTGTPAPNGIEDLWGQLYAVDMGKRLGTKKAHFLGRYFTKNFDGYGHTPLPWARKAVWERVSDVMVSLKSSDVLKDLPPVVSDVKWVELPAEALAHYRELRRTLAIEELQVDSPNRAALTGKLTQFANGGLYRTDEEVYPPRREVIEVHDAKLAALQQIREDTPGESLLVAYSFQFDRDRILRRFPDAVVAGSDVEVYARWNRGEIPMLIAHPASIGHGLNLQFGGNRIVWFGLTASLELYQQFNARLPRPGQSSDRVFVTHIMAHGTFDERLYGILRTKGAEQDEILDAVKAHLGVDPTG